MSQHTRLAVTVPGFLFIPKRIPMCEISTVAVPGNDALYYHKKAARSHWLARKDKHQGGGNGDWAQNQLECCPEQDLGDVTMLPPLEEKTAEMGVQSVRVPEETWMQGKTPSCKCLCLCQIPVIE